MNEHFEAMFKYDCLQTALIGQDVQDYLEWILNQDTDLLKE